MPASPSARRKPKKRGKLRGIGMSCYIEACGIAPSAGGRLARRRRRPVGIGGSARQPGRHVEVLTGSHSHGQGHETTFAQLVSDRLGVPIDSVSIVHGDTDKVQLGMGTYGSRSGAVGMSAIVKALDKVEAKAKKIAAHLLEADEATTSSSRTAVHRQAGTDKSVPWFQVALAAYIAHNLPAAGMEPGLKEGAFYDPTNFTFPAGCTSARSRSTRRPARPRSSTWSRWTISATSSIR
jgi:carbon-monoxide dehydrogenase large subunit